jgi:hypothetical protein
LLVRRLKTRQGNLNKMWNQNNFFFSTWQCIQNFFSGLFTFHMFVVSAVCYGLDFLSSFLFFGSLCSFFSTKVSWTNGVLLLRNYKVILVLFFSA